MTLTDLTIQPSATLNILGNTLTISGSFTNFGILQRFTQGGASGPTLARVSKTDVNEGTVEYTGNDGLGAPYYVQDYGSQDYYNLTIDAAASISLNYNLGVNGTLANAATITATTQVISVGGNWTNTGTFTAGTGTVIFSNAALPTTVSGTNTFYNLTIATPGKTVQFTAGTTTTVTNILTLGQSNPLANPVSLTSTTTSPWTLSLTNAATATDVNVSNSTMIGTRGVTANSSINGGNNTTTNTPATNAGWYFPLAAGTYIWNGSTSTIWANGANWDSSTGVNGAGTTYPTLATDIVTIPAINQTTSAAIVNFPVLAATAAITNLTISSGASLDIGTQSVTISGSYFNMGTLKRSGGSSMNQTDATEGTVIYQGAGGSIQNYGSGNS